MTLNVTLICDECGATSDLRPYSRMTKMSVLRLMAGTDGWYVDGGSVYCNRCARGRLNWIPQRETWTEYDRRVAAMEADERAYLDDILDRIPGLAERARERT